MRSVTIGAGCLDAYPWMKFAYCFVDGLALCDTSTYISSRQTATEQYVRDNITALSEKAKSISRFYRSQGEKNRSHIESLLKAIANGKTIKPVNSIVDAVIIAEMRHALLLGVHDLGTIVGDIRVDVAQDGEVFLGLARGVGDAVAILTDACRGHADQVIVAPSVLTLPGAKF